MEEDKEDLEEVVEDTERVSEEIVETEERPLGN